MATRRRRTIKRVTITVTATGRPTAIAQALRRVAEDLEEAGDYDAHGIERVLENGHGRPIGRVEVTEDDE